MIVVFIFLPAAAFIVFEWILEKRQFSKFKTLAERGMKLAATALDKDQHENHVEAECIYIQSRDTLYRALDVDCNAYSRGYFYLILIGQTLSLRLPQP